MVAVFWLIDAVLQLYIYIIFAMVILSWLIAFNVVNMSNRFVAAVASFLHEMTEPVLRPIRNILPSMGAIDLSPIVLLFGIMFLQILLRTTIAPAFGVFGY